MNNASYNLLNLTSILLEEKDGIARIILNRPEKRNALDVEMVQDLEAALAAIEKQNDVRVVIITGNGDAFCAGGDLKFMKEILHSGPDLQAFLTDCAKAFNHIRDLGKPVIAAVNGSCLAGGLEMVQMCDIVIASEEACLGDQHANIDLVPAMASMMLPRLVGTRKAKELIFTGKSISGKEAEKIGLVNMAVQADELEAAVNEMAYQLKDKSPIATQNMKWLLNRALETDIQTGMDLAFRVSMPSFTTEDAAEALKAFEEKRKPVFKGR